MTRDQWTVRRIQEEQLTYEYKIKSAQARLKYRLKLSMLDDYF